MPAVVEAVGTDAALVEQIGQVVVPPLVLGQPVYDDCDADIVARHLFVQVELRSVER